MCPACMMTAAILATGATSAGGMIGFLVAKRSRRERQTPRSERDPPNVPSSTAKGISGGVG